MEPAKPISSESELGNPLDGDAITIYVVRHGSTKLNEEDRLRGWLDVPLSDEGLKQADKIGSYFKEIPLKKIYCSDLGRAVQTAAPISKNSGAEVVSTGTLRPINFGILQGQPVKKIEPEMLAIQEKWKVDPDAKVKEGESFTSFQSRNVAALKAILEEAEPKSHVALVAHLRNCIYFLAYIVNGGQLEGEDLDLLNRITQDVAGISVVKFNKSTGEMQLHKQNYTEHLLDGELESGGGQSKEMSRGQSISWLPTATAAKTVQAHCGPCTPLKETVIQLLLKLDLEDAVRDLAAVMDDNDKFLEVFDKIDRELVMKIKEPAPVLTELYNTVATLHWIKKMTNDGIMYVPEPEKDQKSSQILIGTSGFKYKHWSENFYPKDLPGRDWLRYYAEKFPTVEISSTFHNMPEPRVLKAWNNNTPDNFIFAIRAPKAVTHDSHLYGAGPLMAAFMRRLEILGDKLGPVTFQLQQSQPFDGKILRSFAESLPSGFKYSIEFRSEPWYNKQTYEILAKHNIAIVVVGHSYMGIHTVKTADWSHIRMSGHNPDYKENSYTNEQLMNWRGIIADAAKPSYVYFNNEYRAFAALNATKLMDLMAVRYSPSKTQDPKGTPTPRGINPEFYGKPADNRSNGDDNQVEQYNVMEQSPSDSPSDSHIKDPGYGASDW